MLVLGVKLRLVAWVHVWLGLGLGSGLVPVPYLLQQLQC